MVAPSELDKRRVLLIDDEAAFTRLVKDTLEETGRYEVLTENDSAHAENRARETNPDVVVIDIIMAPRDGAEVLTSFESDPELSGIPLIIMSAFLNNRVFPNSPVDFGERDVLEKPMNLDEVRFLIERIEIEVAKKAAVGQS